MNRPEQSNLEALDYITDLQPEMRELWFVYVDQRELEDISIEEFWSFVEAFMEATKTEGVIYE